MEVKKKCAVCIGCGRCGEYPEDLQVITNSFLKSELLAVDSTDKGSFVIVDIGTTTIAMEAYNKQGKKLADYVQPNPQRIFGRDVISRIQAAERPLVAKQMQGLVKQVLLQGLEEFQKEVPDIRKVYVAGNTTMLYLLLGYDTTELGYAPFIASYLETAEIELGEWTVHVLPGLSAFVGSDILAGILAGGMDEKKNISLLIDLGTNGEIVLGNREKMIACATAAGPAFEGMLEEDRQALWGADLVKAVAVFLDKGILDETGLLTEPYFTEGVTIAGVQITQEHVRNLQTAKAAIAAGIEILVEAYGISLEDIGQVYLAGGFGYFLEEEAAIRIGLLPKALKGKVQAVGNSALAGCYAYHFAGDAEEKLARIKELTKVINLAEWEGFSQRFVENMYLR
ncbi:MAG: DUF4445 domain-containing protein [Lachnospiraceae bacterium]|nr:DUF4445 domain-containing protein [Lachnospiraceae bacterium]